MRLLIFSLMGFCSTIFIQCQFDTPPTAPPIWQLLTHTPVNFLQVLDEETVGAKSADVYVILKKSTGQILEQIYPADQWLEGAFLDGDRIYYGDRVNTFYCYDSHRKEMVWEFRTLSENAAIPLLDSNNVYWGSTDSTIYALDKFSGQLKWKYQTGCHIYSTPIALDSLLIIGSWDTRLYAFHRQSGQKLWEFAAQAGIDQLPVIGGQLLWLANYDSYIYGLDLATGELRYQYKADNAFEFSGVLWDNNLIFSGIDRYIYFVDPLNGQCSRKGSVPVAISTSPLVVGDWLFTGHYDGSVYRWDLPGVTPTLVYRFGDRVVSLLSDGRYLWAASWDRSLAGFDVPADTF